MHNSILVKCCWFCIILAIIKYVINLLLVISIQPLLNIPFISSNAGLHFVINNRLQWADNIFFCCTIRLFQNGILPNRFYSLIYWICLLATEYCCWYRYVIHGEELEIQYQQLTKLRYCNYMKIVSNFRDKCFPKI